MKKVIGGASVRELKAAALDNVVKAELAKTRAAQASKISGLKALRLARDAELHATKAPVAQAKAKSRTRKIVPLRRAS
jgi:hypothetical protein